MIEVYVDNSFLNLTVNNSDSSLETNTLFKRSGIWHKLWIDLPRSESLIDAVIKFRKWKRSFLSKIRFPKSMFTCKSIYSKILM